LFVFVVIDGMSEANAKLPAQIVRELNHQCRIVRLSVHEKNARLMKLASSVGLTYKPPDTTVQENALIAALTAQAFYEQKELYSYKEQIYKAMKVARSSFYKYLSLVLNTTMLSGLLILSSILENHEFFLWK